MKFWQPQKKQGKNQNNTQTSAIWIHDICKRNKDGPNVTHTQHIFEMISLRQSFKNSFYSFYTTQKKTLETCVLHEE